MSEARKQRAERVARWRRSGLSARVDARSIGVNASTLTYWAWRLGQEKERVRATALAVASSRTTPAG